MTWLPANKLACKTQDLSNIYYLNISKSRLIMNQQFSCMQDSFWAIASSAYMKV